MQLKALILCTVVAGALNVKLSAADVAGVPHGWSVSDDAAKQYEVGYDYAEHAAYIRALVAQPTHTVALMQALDPQAYAGHLLHVSAEVRDDNPNGRFELFLHGTGRNDDGKSNETLAITTTNSAPGEWHDVSFNIKLNAASQEKLSKLALGFAMQGDGRVWMRNVKISEVQPAQVASAHIEPLSKSVPLPAFQHAPSNLEMAP